MRLIDPMVAKAGLFVFLSVFDVGFLLAGYGLLRTLHILVS